MAKTKTAFFCQNCGAQSPKWIGRCPACGEWNTYVEEVVQKPQASGRAEVPGATRKVEPVPVQDIEEDKLPRFLSSNGEFDRVLGGGIVPGSLVLVGGEPGIGKSTLLLQIALKLSGKKILYVTGEESEQQIRMRAGRVGIQNETCYLLPETNTQEIFRHIDGLGPDLVIIDSIQTLHTNHIESSPGSISQIRECAAEFQKYSKLSGVPVFLVGHITKDGYLAGPKVLEHMVDTVLQFEGERNYGYRILRSIKNRFGPTSELGIYEMHESGMKEVLNPSEILVSQREEEVSGVSVASTIEGIRPMLIETQALVSTAAYGTPQRSTTGFDTRRLNMLLAVLEKRSGFRLGSKDVFLNIAGGIRVDDPAIDLAVVMAILSSNADIPVPGKKCFAAEVGLSGEIRPVSRVEQRIIEAEKLGMEEIFISNYNFKGLERKKFSIDVIPLKRIEQGFQRIFG
jgi:DNA repair protein RadA/Sms